MFGIGMQELAIIFVVALLIFGPKRLPELARTLGKGLAEFRRASTDLRQSFDLETRGAPPSTPPSDPPAVGSTPESQGSPSDPREQRDMAHRPPQAVDAVSGEDSEGDQQEAASNAGSEADHTDLGNEDDEAPLAPEKGSDSRGD